MKRKSIPLTQAIEPLLLQDDFAVELLNCSLQDDDVTVFLLTLKQLADARGIRIGKLATQTGLKRGTLYQALSEDGNPELKSLRPILAALGFRLTVAHIAS